MPIQTVRALLLSLTLCGSAVGVAQAQPTATLKAPQLTTPLQLANGPLKVYATSPTRWLTRSEDPQAMAGLRPARHIELAGARNESEQVILILRSDEPLQGITFTAGPLKGAGEIAASAWTAEPVGHVTVATTGKWYGIWHEVTGDVPDPLLPPGPVATEPGLNTVLLVTLRLPADAPAGDYEGRLTLTPQGKGQAVHLPVKVQVWDITLPQERQLTTMTTELDQKDDTYAFMKRKGINSLKYGVRAPKVKVDKAASTVQLDAQAYLDAVDNVLGRHGHHSVALPPSLLGTTSSLSKNYLSTGIPVGADAFWPIYRAYMHAMNQAYQSRGVADRVIFYMMDEIYENHYPTLAKVAQEAKVAYPQIRTMVVTNELTDEVARHMDIWVSPWHFFVTREEDVYRWDRLRAQGVELWGYMNSLYTLNTKASLKDLRFYPAVLAKYGYKGNLWWSINHYAKQDPWKGGIATLENTTRKERHYANGYLFYPPREQDPQWRSSLRWEAYEQGLDEYDLLITLKQRHAQVRKALGAAAQGEPFSEDHAMRWWGSLLSTSFRLQTYRQDGQYIHRFRQLLAHEITHINQRPYVLVDAEPDQAMLMTSRTLHVRGVAEAGVRIHLNGRPLGMFSADKPYVFWDEVPLKPGDNTVTILAIAADGTQKTLYREVRVSQEP